MKHSFLLPTLIACLLVLSGFSYIHAQWTPVPGVPPTNNVVELVNIGSILQNKAGNLQAQIFAAFSEMRSNRYCDALGNNCFNTASLGGGGAVTSLTAGPGILVNPSIITSTGTISTDQSYTQRRVLSCPTGQVIRQINVDGTVVCQTVATNCVWEGVSYTSGYVCRTGATSCGSGTQYFYKRCLSGSWDHYSQCTLSTPSTPLCS